PGSIPLGPRIERLILLARPTQVDDGADTVGVKLCEVVLGRLSARADAIVDFDWWFHAASFAKADRIYIAMSISASRIAHWSPCISRSAREPCTTGRGNESLITARSGMSKRFTNCVG